MNYLLLLKIALLFLYTTSVSYAEKKIKKEQVPTRIITYLEKEYADAKKIEFYIESSQDTTYYEVELVHHQENISLIFLKDGTMYEIEKEIAFDKLPYETQETIEHYLSSTYKSYKITTVQFVNPHLKTEYELNIKAKVGAVHKFYEMYFNEKGELLLSKEVFMKPIPTLF